MPAMLILRSFTATWLVLFMAVFAPAALAAETGEAEASSR